LHKEAIFQVGPTFLTHELEEIIIVKENWDHQTLINLTVVTDLTGEGRLLPLVIKGRRHTSSDPYETISLVPDDTEPSHDDPVEDSS
jgi:hypothetical protein